MYDPYRGFLQIPSLKQPPTNSPLLAIDYPSMEPREEALPAPPIRKYAKARRTRMQPKLSLIEAQILSVIYTFHRFFEGFSKLDSDFKELMQIVPTQVSFINSGALYDQLNLMRESFVGNLEKCGHELNFRRLCAIFLDHLNQIYHVRVPEVRVSIYLEVLLVDEYDNSNMAVRHLTRGVMANKATRELCRDDERLAAILLALKKKVEDPRIIIIED